jgi:flagellar M-ring protein FliF
MGHRVRGDVQQIIKTWSGLDTGKKFLIGLASIAVLAAFVGLFRIASNPGMTLLYAGLEATAAGDVIQSLEQKGIHHEVRGGAIYVESSARDMLRMTLAAEGLPENGMQGYELLDTLTGFGTTSQMFDAAYWRAKEGELARTIVASPMITAARVHIANTGSNPFQRAVTPSASVTLTTTGGSVAIAQARAIKFLVASAVPGLKTDDVAVIDSVVGLVATAEDQGQARNGDDRSDALRDRVLRLLEARVGVGNVVVEVDISTDFVSETVRERIVDPSSRVAISTDTEESSNDSTGAADGSVTVASNLPDGEAAGTEGSRSSNNQTRERINYEISETSREVLRSPGTVKRITVAVLVNGIQQVNAEGQLVLEPRNEDELEALKDLVSSAVGLDEARGDLVTLKSMEFLQNAPMGTFAESSLFQSLGLDAMSLIQMAVLAIVTLLLGLFVLRPILTSKAEPYPEATFETTARRSIGNAGSGNSELTPLTGEIADDDFEFGALPAAQTSTGIPSVSDPDKVADPVDRLRALIAERQDETVEILRGWIEDRGEKA